MRLTAAVLLFLLTLPAFAQTQAEAHVLPRVIDMLCIDLVEARNGCETAVLLMSDADQDAVDLVLFSDRRAFDPQEILLTVRSIAFSGPMFGQAPGLERSESGTLLLHSGQDGVGRHSWTLTLTIVHRDDGFLVAGQTFTTYDRILGGWFSCDMNLLTGGWTMTAERFNIETDETTYDVSTNGRIAAARPDLADWSYAHPLPSPCRQALDAWDNAADE